MASLVLLDGLEGGKHFPIKGDLTSVGRDHECTIQVLDDRVSRHHLQVVRDPGSPSFFARDCRSANGVFINGRQIDLDTVLSDGDRIGVGSTTLVFLADDHPSDAAALAAAKSKDQWKRTTIIRGASSPSTTGLR